MMVSLMNCVSHASVLVDGAVVVIIAGLLTYRKCGGMMMQDDYIFDVRRKKRATQALELLEA